MKLKNLNFDIDDVDGMGDPITIAISNIEKTNIVTDHPKTSTEKYR